MKYTLIILLVAAVLAYFYKSIAAKHDKEDQEAFRDKKRKAHKVRLAAQDLEKTSEMLDEDIFWKIVDASVVNTEEEMAQGVYLINEIEKLSPKQIIGFRLRTDKLLYDTYNSAMWCAGYIMNGGCSDDGFEYFRLWVISRGKEVYYAAKENPDSLVSQLKEGDHFYEFESFWYVALTAFEQKTGKELYDYIADDFKYSESNYPNFEFTWEEDKPESMQAICPRLYEKLWH